MFGLTQIPEVVSHYAPAFRSLFSAASYEHFQRYLTGLLISDNKTVQGINRLFVLDERDQSSLNRFLTQYEYDELKLNEQRLDLLQQQPASSVKAEGRFKGCITLDDTLLHHRGHHFDQIAMLYDPVSKQYGYAHDLVNLYYSDDQTDYPVYYQLWQPVDVIKLEQALKKAKVSLNPDKVALRQTDPKAWRSYLLLRWKTYQYTKPELQKAYQSKLTIARILLRQFAERFGHLSLPVTFDNWYTRKDLCQYIDQELQLPYVGKLSPEDRLIKSGSAQQSLQEFAQGLKNEQQTNPEHSNFKKTVITFKDQLITYYAYCRTHRIKNFGKQRLVIRHRQADLSDEPVFLISNQLNWRASGILRTYRHRWPVEVFHQEAKAEGLQQYQVRDFQAINRHIALVVVAYSLLQLARHDPELLSRLQQHIHQSADGSLAFWRRMTKAQAFFALIQWITLAIQKGQSLEQVLRPFISAIAH